MTEELKPCTCGVVPEVTQEKDIRLSEVYRVACGENKFHVIIAANPWHAKILWNDKFGVSDD